MGQEDLTGSFAPEGQQEKKKQPKSIDANAPLFRLMGEIRDAIKDEVKAINENTEAMNSLLTTLVGQTRDGPHMHLDVKQTTPEEAKPVEQPTIPLPETISEITSTTPSTPIEDIRMMFPESLENLLTFTDEGDYIKVKPRQFLGSDNFAKIASIVRGVGGEYKSAGKESHFRVPK